ncbi:MAG: 50S ribosomal protein L3 [Microgenomates group bacterium]
MSGYILGEKAHQSQQFTSDGVRVPTTTIKSASCYCIGLTDTSIKLGFGRGKNVKKPQVGELKKAGIETPLRFFREIKLNKLKEASIADENGKKTLTLGEFKIVVGDQIKPNAIFKEGELVTVTGISKGKGFQGVVKRHGFAGGPKTHGQSDRWRAPGSIGQTTTPGRVYKGKRMAGRMGNDRVSVKGLMVMGVSDDQIIVKGLIPGARTALISIVSNS